MTPIEHRFQHILRWELLIKLLILALMSSYSWNNLAAWFFIPKKNWVTKWVTDGKHKTGRKTVDQKQESVLKSFIDFMASTNHPLIIAIFYYCIKNVILGKWPGRLIKALQRFTVQAPLGTQLGLGAWHSYEAPCDLLVKYRYNTMINIV